MGAPAVTTVAVLIATRDRPDLLASRALPSVSQQTRPPEQIVVVNDGSPFTRPERERLYAAAEVAGVPLTVLPNQRRPGAGGAWNSGLEHLHASGHRGFVALLDDDDSWDPDHLAVNSSAATDALIVVSGLRMVLQGRVAQRSLITALAARDFLVGNPGWQGSNTFVDLGLLLDAGGFREQLLSLNDRDLAYRLLLRAGDRVRFTGRWTATWYADTPRNLSAPRSKAKRDGLGAFWRLYGGMMGPDEARAFFERAYDLFGVSESEIRQYRGSPPQLGFPESADGERPAR